MSINDIYIYTRLQQYATLKILWLDGAPLDCGIVVVIIIVVIIIFNKPAEPQRSCLIRLIAFMTTPFTDEDL